MKINLYLTFEDKPYVKTLEALAPSHQFNHLYSLPVTSLDALMNCDAVVTTNPSFIKLITQKSKCNIQDYAGSLWQRQDVSKKEKEILCINPLKQLVTTKPGKFLTKRFLSKILTPSNWPVVPKFTWELADDDVAITRMFNDLTISNCISVDIETGRSSFGDHIIKCVAYTGVYFDPQGNLSDLKTYVLPITSFGRVKWMRTFNALQIPKIFQNGKYDNFYFLRYNAPVWGWFFDTMHAHHAFLSELPKNLGYITAFYLRDIAYWKDEGQTGDLFDLYRYNAKDSFTAALVFLTWLKEAPQWAYNNYLKEFPLVFPCLASELDGLKINETTRQQQLKEQNKKNDEARSSLAAKVGVKTFNPRSPTQVLALLHILGCKDLKSSDERSLEVCGDRHPLNRLLIDEIKSVRAAGKLISTYLEADLYRGKLLYSLNPAGTDTGRLASKESSLWCGTQLQNLPEYYKRCIEAEEGYYFGEGDYEQSETRCTAYLSGDENLIKTVEDVRDFHSVNAEAFFGIPYQVIYDEAKKAKLDQTEHKTKRYLIKRVGHGSNYNMGAAVLLAVMGLNLVVQTQRLLNLNPKWKPIQVTQYLIDQYSKTYPKIKGKFYPWIVASIRTSKTLVSSLGWTRYCFGIPWNSKPDLNSYVAHVPSNLSVGIINEAFLEIFRKLHLRCNGDFRLKGQIHDSIPFTYRIGRIDLALEAKELMTRPKQITDCEGKKRWMTIPVSMKAEGTNWTQLKTI